MICCLVTLFRNPTSKSIMAVYNSCLRRRKPSDLGKAKPFPFIWAFRVARRACKLDSKPLDLLPALGMRSRHVLNFEPMYWSCKFQDCARPAFIEPISNIHSASLVGTDEDDDAWLAGLELQMWRVRRCATRPLLCRSHPCRDYSLISRMPSK